MWRHRQLRQKWCRASTLQSTLQLTATENDVRSISGYIPEGKTVCGSRRSRPRALNSCFGSGCCGQEYIVCYSDFFFEWVYSESMLGRIIVSISFVAAVILFALLHATTPATIGPLGILFVFILMYFISLGLITFLMLGVNALIFKATPADKLGHKDQPMTVSRAYYFASVIALAPVIVIGMQSVGETSIYDLMLVGLFVAFGCFYIAKRTS